MTHVDPDGSVWVEGQAFYSKRYPWRLVGHVLRPTQLRLMKWEPKVSGGVPVMEINGLAETP